MSTASDKNFMAIDQYGQTYHSLGPHPRKALLERLGCSSARRIYRDLKNGGTVHVGYLIGGMVLDLFEVVPFARRVN